MSDLKQYVDVNDALNRIGGNKGLYKKLLSQFINENYVSSMKKSIDSASTEDLLRHAHSLKGVCANLSLKQLAFESAELEKKIKDNQDYSENFSDLIQVYDQTLVYVNLVLSED